MAIYAVLTNQTEDYPYGVTFTGGGDLDTFYSVYWSMTQVTGLSNSNGAAISVNRLSVAEGAKRKRIKRNTEAKGCSAGRRDGHCKLYR